jgi:glucuronokinase
MGNPSDGFGGKTISCMIANFGARVSLRESSTIEIVRHPIYDPLSFRSLSQLSQLAAHDGYYGGIRLLFATCKRFFEFCTQQGIELPERNFALQYDTDIPRQMGLAGSSAIITAAVKALVDFYELEAIPRALMPNLILSVETEELGIQAGLQDRVVQTYGGLVYMDFAPQHFERMGHGDYETMPISLLPPLYLAHADAPSDSGKVHSGVRYRFDQGDPEVVSVMAQLAELAGMARDALLDRDYDLLGVLMNRNFDLRRLIYGDDCIGKRNLEMIELARSLGLPAKFPGSGGAIVGICDSSEKFRKARAAFRERGFEFLEVLPANGAAAAKGLFPMTIDAAAAVYA